MILLVINCKDNKCIEKSGKSNWLFKVNQPTREFMKQDVAAYMKYYNLEQLHSANGDLSLVEFENSQLKVSGLG